MKKTLKRRIANLRKYVLGRCLMRLVGEENGAVMMEYVLVCSLIAVAATVGIAAMGRGIVDGFGFVGKGLMGEHTQATKNRTTAIMKLQTNMQAAQAYADATHK